MAKQRISKREQGHNHLLSPEEQFQKKLQSLLERKKYRQALEEIHKAQRSQPDLVITPSEAEIWLLRGKQEFEQDNFKQADHSLRRALELGYMGEPHYWLAKCLLRQNRLDEAIALLQDAFDAGSLPSAYSICYAKLLLLQGDTATVEQLLKKQSKRFPAAQRHWLQGVLSLKAEQPEAALASFKKIKRPTTPGDRPDVWQIYAQQAVGDWDAAALRLGFGLKSAWGISPVPLYIQHPLLQRLALHQHLTTGQPPFEEMQFRVGDWLSVDLLEILSLLVLVSEENLSEAAYALLKIEHPNQFPELAALRPALLTLGGYQALTMGEAERASQFWQVLQHEQPFNPQLSVNLMKALDLNHEYQELKRLLIRIIKWLEQDFQQNPQAWPEERRKMTLGYAHCRLADTWIALGRTRAAMGELQAAERIDPQSPEVKGRHGLVAVSEERYDEGTQLLTQALEEGCRYPEVYGVLVETLKELGNSEAALEIRRRFGKQFGDFNPEADIEVLPWVEALSTGDYGLFSHLVEVGSDRDPAMQACQIFVDATEGEPNSGGKIALNQAQAIEEWDQLLQDLAPQEQGSTLQAIALSLLLFAKRAKGIAALTTKYMLQLYELGSEQPEARKAHLVILALKERDSKKLQMPIQSYLSTMPQPGNALAQIQLQVRRYASTIRQDHILRSFLDESLKREPQNPLLLLAKATTYPVNHPDYERLKQQGFDLARRLQDAKALQAYREEEAFLNAQTVQDFLPTPDAFANFGIEDMDEFLENMIRKMLGSQVSPAELKRMLPKLKQMMMDDMPDFGMPDFGMPDFSEVDEDEAFGFPTSGFAPPSRPPKRKRK